MTDTITNLAKQLEPFFTSKSREGLVRLNENFVTIGNSPNLNQERALVAGVLMDLLDGGANGLATLDVQLALVARVTLAGDTFEHPADAAGLAAALAAAVAGDVVLVPPRTISGAVTIPAGVELVGWGRRDTIILTGQVSGGDKSVIRNLTVQRNANDGVQLNAIIGPASGTFFVYDCIVRAIQAGAGNAFAFWNSSGGTLTGWGSDLSGQSTGGNGYAAGVSSGIIELYHGKAFGTKDRFLVQ